MTAPIPMLHGRTLTDATLLRLALFGLATALDIKDPTAKPWVRGVIAEAGIDIAQFREDHEMNVAAYRAGRQAPAADLVAALRRNGLL